MQDALLAGLVFGYIPPLRDNSILVTLTHPGHKAGCLHPDCQHRVSCPGNRVYKYGANWKLEAPHHKNTKRWQGTAIKLDLPSELGQLLDHHTGWGLNTLTRTAGSKLQPYLFCNSNTGQPLKPQEVSMVWQQAVLEGTGIKFSPQLCRSIFVVGTRDRQLGGMLGSGAAMAMGNSEKVWDSVYDRHFNARQVRDAMAAMPAWRQRMLEQGQQQVPEAESSRAAELRANSMQLLTKVAQAVQAHRRRLATPSSPPTPPGSL